MTRKVLPAIAALMIASPAFAEETSSDRSQRRVEFGAGWTGDLIGTVDGGARQGGRFLHNLDLTAAWSDGNGWEAFGYVLGNANGGFSEHYVGDAQVVSNIDAPPGVRLFEAWVRRTSEDARFDVTFGLINLNGLFDVQDTGSLFLNSSHGIGADYSQSGPSIFPISSLGLVGQWRVSDALTVRGGVFDAVPGNANDDSRFAYIRLSGDEGAHLVAEADYSFTGGSVKLGHWTNTLARSAPHRPSGTYGQVQLTVTREAGDDAQGLRAWVRAGQSDRHTLDIDRYAGGGLVYTGPIRGRDEDRVGVSVAHARFHATGAAETTWELSYQAMIRQGVSLQPDLQYITHPGGDPAVKSALVAGIRVRVDLLGL